MTHAERITRTFTPGSVEVVELSLLPIVTNELEEKLRPNVEAGKLPESSDTDTLDKLAAIVSEALGEDIMKELASMHDETASKKRVYVIHGIPEIKDALAKNIFKDVDGDMADKELAQTYNLHFMKGLYRAMKLNQYAQYTQVRRVDSDINDLYHNHYSEVSMLGGIVSDGSPTKFLNLTELAQDVEANQIKVHRSSGFFGKGAETEPTVASDFLNRAQWKSEMSVRFFDEDKNAETIEKYEKEIFADKGDLIIWPDKNGDLLHRAVASKSNNATYGNHEIVRIISVGFADKPLPLYC